MNQILTEIKHKYGAWLISVSLMFLAVFVFIFQFFPIFPEVTSHNTSDSSLTPKVLGISTQKFVASTSYFEPLEIKIDDQIPELSTISAKSYLVFSLEDNSDILAKNPNLKLPIASLTKLMTGLVAYEKLSLTDYFEIKEPITNTKPSVGVKSGVKYKVEDLFNAMIIGSANDAGQSIAKIIETVTGARATELMNNTAKQLAMDDSHFSNPTGFDSVYNFSTAADLKKLVAKTQQIYAFNSLGKRGSYEFRDSNNLLYKISSTNKLLKKYPEISSIKTGYTENSLGSMIIKANIANKDFVIIVLGSQNREADIEKLFKILTQSYP